ncbi:hypothetical protein [uncultured Sphingomonas sp.]|uniref:hypothetical protein n=1 Tax=uncultured Sphingomonas sp. TaxID=158754 RepID=UPI0035CBA724
MTASPKRHVDRRRGQARLGIAGDDPAGTPPPLPDAQVGLDVRTDHAVARASAS